MVTLPLDGPQVAALAEAINTMLVKIEAGELEATNAMKHRLEGALTALEVVLGHRASLLDGFQD